MGRDTSISNVTVCRSHIEMKLKYQITGILSNPNNPNPKGNAIFKWSFYWPSIIYMPANDFS